MTSGKKSYGAQTVGHKLHCNRDGIYIAKFVHENIFGSCLRGDHDMEGLNEEVLLYYIYLWSQKLNLVTG